MHREDHSDQKPTSARPVDRSADAASGGRAVGRHRAADQRPRWPSALSSTPVRAALATGVSCCVGIAAFAGARAATDPVEPVREALADRAAAAEAADQRASRALDRQVSPAAPTPSATVGPLATSTPTGPARPARPRTVAGLTPLQTVNARVIVDVGVDLRLPRRALVVAVATAMQESNLHNLANEMVPESLRHPHQGSGTDHDSVGLFQQRSSSGWGTVAELMRPAYAARAFYLALREVPGWQELSVTAAAQAVQVSAFPDAYARHEQRAATVVDALT